MSSRAILIIEHQNKMTSQKSLYRGIGSMDIVAAAPSVLLAGIIRMTRI